MPRYIDADTLNSIKFHSLPYTHITPSDVEAESYKRGWNDAIDSIIENAPTIELRCEECEAFNKTRLLVPQPERKKGRWIPVHTGTYEERQKIEWRCSECGAGMYRFYQKFCHECGAKMEGLKVVEDE